MKLHNSFTILGKDLLLGPRGALSLWIVAMPLIMTFLIKMVFGGLIDPSPRLGIVDHGSSLVVKEAQALPGIDVTLLDSEEELKVLVEANDLDAGMVLKAGFDEELQSGRTPPLDLFLGGESLASNRIILLINTLDMIRKVEGSPSPVEVSVEMLGDGTSVPIGERLLPMMVLMAVALAGIFLPASSIVQERETKTIEALLVTPVTIREFIIAKGILGFFLAFIVGAATLLLNNGFDVYLAGHLAVLAVASLMCTQVGIILGSSVKDMTALFTIFKGGSMILFAPAILFLFPSLPRWISMLFPAYYFLGPLYDISIEGALLRDVALDLGIGVVISLGFMAVAQALSKRMSVRMGN